MHAPAPGATIGTERLLLRPFAMGDAEALYAVFADWEVIRWLNLPPWPYTIADAHSFIGQLSNEELTRTAFAITHRGALIGGIGVRMNLAGRTQRGSGPNLGFWLGRAYWGRGFMTEAVRGFVPRVFAAGLGDVIYSGALKGNTASLRVQEKLGFVRDGETLSYARPHDAEFPHVNTVLTRARFEAHAA